MQGHSSQILRGGHGFHAINKETRLVRPPLSTVTAWPLTAPLICRPPHLDGAAQGSCHFVTCAACLPSPGLASLRKSALWCLSDPEERKKGPGARPGYGLMGTASLPLQPQPLCCFTVHGQ